MPTVGEITAFIRGNDDDFRKTAAAVDARADELGRKRPTIKVNVDAVSALARLDAVKVGMLRLTAAQQRVGELNEQGNVKASVLTRALAMQAAAAAKLSAAEGALSVQSERASKSTDKQTKSTRDAHIGMLQLVATLGPVLIPALAAVAAGAVGAGAGLGVLGLAVVGAKKQMQDGTVTGKAFSGSLGTLKTDFGTLAAAASVGVLAGFQGSVTAVHGAMGPLLTLVQQLAPAIGSGLSSVVSGLVTLMVRLGPLAQTVADSFSHGAASFADWAAHSDGPSRFIAYASKELPHVIDAVEAIARAFGKLILAAGPLGGVVLTGLTLVAKAISAIPLPVLQTLVPLMISFGLALKGIAIASAVSAGITKLSGSLVTLGLVQATATTGSFALMGVLGKLGLVAAATYLLINGTIQAANDQIGPLAGRQAQVADETLKLIANSVHQTTEQVTAGVSGTDAAFKSYKGTLGDISTVTSDMLNGLHDKLGNTATATAGVGGALQSLKDDAAAAAGQVGPLTAQLNAAKTAAYGETAQLQDLANALDALSNNTIDAKEQELHLKDAMHNLVEQSGTMGHSLDQNTTKGRANFEGILDLIHGINAHAESVGKQTHSVGKATDALRTDEDALRDSMHQAGFTKGQIDKLIDSYAATPKEVATKVKADTAAAAKKVRDFQYQLDALHDVQLGLDVYVRRHGTVPSGATYQQNAAGGLIKGPGTGTSDSILSRLSAGEFVVPADVTRKYLPQLQAMRAGTSTLPSTGGYRAGGQVGGDMYVTVIQNIAGSVVTEHQLWNKGIAEINRQRRMKGMRGITDSPGAPLRVPALPDVNPEVAN